MEHKERLERLFAEGFHDFPEAKAELVGVQPYELGFSAAAELRRLEAARELIFAKAKEFSGGAVGRIGFV